jgi:hypothetical protein
MPIVSPVRAVGTTESGGRSGSSRSLVAGAGAMDGSADAAAGAAEVVGFGVPAMSAPGRAGTDPANAGPGVIGTRAGAIVTRGASVALVPVALVSADLVPAAGCLVSDGGGSAGGSDGFGNTDGAAVSTR